MNLIMTTLLIAALTSANLLATADWGRDVIIPSGEHRGNIYDLPEQELASSIEEGLHHTHTWPIKSTGLLIPFRPFKNIFDLKTNNPLKKLINTIVLTISPIQSENDLYAFLGLNDFNDESATGIYRIPYPGDKKPNRPYGSGIVESERGKGLSFSCAACHSANLFGTTVVGMPNKITRANEFFLIGKSLAKVIKTKSFQFNTNANKEEVALFEYSIQNLKNVETVRPPTIGLDTSLAQVGLSLSRRGLDPYASESSFYQIFPRPNPLRTDVSASKPMPWWNLKYKTRWLADGSIVAGNPVLTNILWNEIGRGADLEELERWMKENEDTIQALTSAVFATQPPKWTDFFSADSINIKKAQSGEKIFNQSCIKCHGSYTKGWSDPLAHTFNKKQLLETTQVFYPEKTLVKDVGTDPKRYKGMNYFSDRLNELAISKTMNTYIEPQKGYVPPPLVGIWSRWPYFHNNSIPNLCALLTRPDKRPKSFYIAGSDKKEYFDSTCVGYFTGSKTPNKFKKKRFLFNTKKEGLSNSGHFRAFINKDGQELLSPEQKHNLIEYLKTL